MLLLKSFTSDDRSIVPPLPVSYLSSRSYLYFHYASGFSTQILAYTLDSLVRVSRRVNENHFVSIPNPQRASCFVHHDADPAHFCPKTLPKRQTEPHLAGGLFLPHSSPRYHPSLYLSSEAEAAEQRHSPEIQSDADSPTATEHPHDCPNPNERFYHTASELLRPQKVKYNRQH